MLKAAKIAIACVVLLVVIGSSFAQSRKHAHPRNPTAQSEQTTGTTQTGTEQSPFFVKIVPAPQTAERPGGLAPQEADKPGTDSVLDILTGILAGVAFLQLLVFGWQGIQLRNAVKASRDEFLAAHRPKVRLKHLWLKSDIWSGEEIVLELTMVNTGTAEGIGAEVGVVIQIVKTDRPLPPKIPINASANLGRQKLICGKNLTLPPLSTGVTLTAEENTEIQNGRSKLYCVGYISYLDGAERMRITGFCRLLTFPPNNLALAGNCRFRKFRDPDYEYED